MPVYFWVTTPTDSPKTCRSTTSRVVPVASLAVGRCQTCRRTFRSATWSPTPGGAPDWTCGRTPVSASPAPPTNSPSPRGTPRPPSLRHPGGPAPGPIPGTDGYQSQAPYGAQQYAPDGTSLYPGLPPAPPSGRPREAGPAPAGSEPFVPPVPDGPPPTCGVVTGQCVPRPPPPYAPAP